MSRLSRLLRHLRTTRADGRRAFPDATLAAIQAAIAEGEARHRAEVRLIVEPALDMHDILQNMTPRERARELFSQYGVWNTEENCGVLVYINLADHQVEIVADRGVGCSVSESEWQAICQRMTQGFGQGDFHGSVLAALSDLNALLIRLYPDDGVRRNQLPDQPMVL